MELPVTSRRSSRPGGGSLRDHGDQSPAGAREAYEAWIAHLKPGGVLIVGNSIPRQYSETPDGNWLLASTELVYPRFLDVRPIGMATIAIKA